MKQKGVNPFFVYRKKKRAMLHTKRNLHLAKRKVFLWKGEARKLSAYRAAKKQIFFLHKVETRKLSAYRAATKKSFCGRRKRANFRPIGPRKNIFSSFRTAKKKNLWHKVEASELSANRAAKKKSFGLSNRKETKSFCAR